MRTCVQSRHFFKNRKKRRERVLRKMATMRAAKARRRLENPVEREPKFVRYFPLQLGVRDKLTGDAGWVDFKSVREASRRLSIIQKFYQPSHRRAPREVLA